MWLFIGLWILFVALAIAFFKSASADKECDMCHKPITFWHVIDNKAITYIVCPECKEKIDKKMAEAKRFKRVVQTHEHELKDSWGFVK